jgi:hypothetical protein
MIGFASGNIERMAAPSASSTIENQTRGTFVETFVHTTLSTAVAPVVAPIKATINFGNGCVNAYKYGEPMAGQTIDFVLTVPTAAASLSRLAGASSGSVLATEFTESAALRAAPGRNGALRGAKGRFATNPDVAGAAASAKSAAQKPHGNTAGDQLAHLYARYDGDGNFMKWGVTQDLTKRYSKAELAGGNLQKVASGPRKEMLARERELVETQPGPMNKERWAGKRKQEEGE